LTRFSDKLFLKTFFREKQTDNEPRAISDFALDPADVPDLEVMP
jgi:hypothetical protein